MTTAGQASRRGDTQAKGVSSFQRVADGLGRLLVRWRNFIRSEVAAEGYEDETGFHYGSQPHPHCVNVGQYSRKPEEREAFEQTRTVAAMAGTQKLVSASFTGSHSLAPGRKQ